MLIQNPISLLPKQTSAWDYLEDRETTELGYGGGAGGGKTELGCYFGLVMSDLFPGSRGAIGRYELKNLRLTTLTSFFEVARKLGVRIDGDFKYNQQDSALRFRNGSEILLLDTAPSSRDPMYTRFGSLELSWAWIDESNETPYTAIEILNTRVGRRNKNPEWEETLKQYFGNYDEKDGWVLKPMFLETFNPEKGHIYRRFWKPFKTNTLPDYRKFVRALPRDNPHLPEAYIQKILRSSKVTVERLFYGNFDYDDDPMKIFEYDKITDLFSNIHVKGGKQYISGDIAGKGKDKTVLYVWEGLRVIHIYSEDYTDQRLLEKKILELKEKFEVPTSNIILDYDGIGVGIVDQLQCKGFQANASPVTTQEEKDKGLKANYANLRSQCWFKLAELVNDSKVHVECEDEKVREMITEELDVIKEIDDGKDRPRRIIPKGSLSKEDENNVTIRTLLGRSPDFGDGLMMRMYYELENDELFFSVV